MNALGRANVDDRRGKGGPLKYEHISGVQREMRRWEIKAVHTHIGTHPQARLCTPFLSLAVSPCSVESSDLNWKRKKSGGIKIICQSEMRDFSAMAFITDHVNALIEQWFPGEAPAPS